LFDGFDEPGVEAGVAELGIGEALADGGEEDEVDGGGTGVGFDLAGEGEAVDAGEVEVEEGDVAGIGGGGEVVEGVFGGGEGSDFDEAPGGELVVEDFAVGWVIVDDEGVEAFEGGAWVGVDGGWGGAREGEPEAGALALLADDADGTAHEGDEAFGDGEAEAGTAELAPGGAVGLGEGLEEAGLGFGGDADAGIADGEADGEDGLWLLGGGWVGFGGGSGEWGDFEGDFALVGKLDGVAEEVDEDLAEAAGVAEEGRGDAVVDEAGEFEVFLLGAFGEEIEGTFDEVADVEEGAVEFEAAGFDAGEVEDIVDDGEEAFGAGAGGFGEIALAVVEGGILEEVEHTDDAVEWGADFVAHGGEEVAFGVVGGGGVFFGTFAGLDFEFEGAFGGFAVGDIAGDGLDGEGVAIAEESTAVDLDEAVVAVAVDEFEFEGAGFFAASAGGHSLLDFELAGGGDEVGDSAAQEFAGGVAEGEFEGGVDGEEAAVEVDGGDEVVGGLEEVAVALFEGGFAFDMAVEVVGLVGDAAAEGEDPGEGEAGGGEEDDGDGEDGLGRDWGSGGEDLDVLGGTEEEAQGQAASGFSEDADAGESEEAALAGTEGEGVRVWDGDFGLGEDIAALDGDVGVVGAVEGVEEGGVDLDEFAVVVFGGWCGGAEDDRKRGGGVAGEANEGVLDLRGARAGGGEAEDEELVARLEGVGFGGFGPEGPVVAGEEEALAGELEGEGALGEDAMAAGTGGGELEQGAGGEGIDAPGVGGRGSKDEDMVGAWAIDLEACHLAAQGVEGAADAVDFDLGVDEVSRGGCRRGNREDDANQARGGAQEDAGKAGGVANVG
jgi:hypothetical protein